MCTTGGKKEMTAMDKINEALAAVEAGKKDAADRVRDLGFQWRSTSAHLRAATIVMGLSDAGFGPDMIRRFVTECVELKQFGELKAKEMAGSYLLFKLAPLPVYAQLVDLLLTEDESAAQEAQPKEKQPAPARKAPAKKAATGRKTARAADGK